MCENCHKICPGCERPNWLCECLDESVIDAAIQRVNPGHWLAQHYPATTGSWAVVVMNHNQRGDQSNHVVCYYERQAAERAVHALNTVCQDTIIYAIATARGIIIAVAVDREVLEEHLQPGQTIITFDSEKELALYQRHNDN